MSKKYTPEIILKLEDNEVFVFGSNLRGNHGGGAALAAVKSFGAIQGRGEGMQGQSYAIPTLGLSMEKVPLENIGKSIDKFIEVAKNSPNKTFYMTKIGCGIAGFSIEEIASLFKEREFPENVVMPKEFAR